MGHDPGFPCCGHPWNILDSGFWDSGILEILGFCRLRAAWVGGWAHVRPSLTLVGRLARASLDPESINSAIYSCP